MKQAPTRISKRIFSFRNLEMPLMNLFQQDKHYLIVTEAIVMLEYAIINVQVILLLAITQISTWI
jgi:hypothetical protein